MHFRVFHVCARPIGIIWDQKKANTYHIQRSINTFPWDRVFANTDVNQKVNILNETMKTSSLTLIPMKLLFMMIKIPPWITTKIKDLFQKKSSVYTYYQKRTKSIQLFQMVQYFQNLTATIEINKQKYFRKVDGSQNQLG